MDTDVVILPDYSALLSSLLLTLCFSENVCLIQGLKLNVWQTSECSGPILYMQEAVISVCYKETWRD